LSLNQPVYSKNAYWLHGNAPLLLDKAAVEAGLEFHRGTEAFSAIMYWVGTPDADKRELFGVYTMVAISESVTLFLPVTTSHKLWKSC
jgi:hypothetical protein